MARPLRIAYPGAFYHVTSRGNERKAVFKSQRDREKFLAYLESATYRYSAVIHSYCLMDNHYHLLMETPDGNLPEIMRHINGAYTTYFNVKRARSGHLFQGRYKAILVEIDEYAKELSRYIHLNPVRADMSARPEEYKWSSYRSYIGECEPPDWLCRDFILKYFGEDQRVSEKKYRRFVSALIAMQYDSPLGAVVGSTLLGSDGFIDSIKEKYLYRRTPDKNVPALKELTRQPSRRPSIRQINKLVDTVYWKDPALPRGAKIYLCKKHSGQRLKKIGAGFSISESGVCQASRRFEERINQDRGLEMEVKKIENKLIQSRVKT
jgi:putative transposase